MIAKENCVLYLGLRGHMSLSSVNFFRLLRSTLREIFRYRLVVKLCSDHAISFDNGLDSEASARLAQS